ncbi:response regulator [Schlesneria paludicola]|uniref:response regulator n=1 Tax=Schlesneria paludicola TaxID=360056 RepID=UPI000299D4AE|nr:response regulator [Schlesneria paludicola]
MTLVLIVDDSPIDRALAGGLLEKQGGCSVVFAVDGQSALDAIRDCKPDLIVTDMQMPLMNGLELVARLRKDTNLTPVILMTATGSEELAVEALRVGASSYVAKRSLNKRLIDTARMVLASANEEREQSTLMGRLVSHCESFSLQNRTEECRSMSRYLQSSLATFWSLNRAARLRIGLAVEEALLNALYHGNLEISSELKERQDNSFYELATLRQNEHPYSERRIDVTVQTTSEETRYIIRDGGNGFDVSKLPDPTDPENISRPSGRGVMLMHAFMDSVVYNDRGNEVTLVKKRTSMD